jgi:predicted permease
MTVSSNYFSMLGASPRIGRGFVQQDVQNGATRVAIISEQMWRAEFDANPSALNRDLSVNGAAFRIIGVMPKDFWFQTPQIDIWLPLTTSSGDSERSPVAVVGRLRKGSTPEEARAEAAVLVHASDSEFHAKETNIRIRVATYDSETEKQTGMGMAMLLGPPVLVLLIGCSNITNLLLARGVSRQTEFGIRAALGARRRRIVQQQLTESLMLSGAGGAMGVLFAFAGIIALQNAFAPVNSFIAAGIHLNWHTVVFASVATLLVPMLFGLFPAVRTASGNLNASIRRTSGAWSGRITAKRLPLVVFEVAMAMLLLVTSGLLIRSMVDIQRTALPRLDSSKLISVPVSTASNAIDWNALVTDLKAQPEVTAVGVTADLPLTPSGRDEQTVEADFGQTRIVTSAVSLNVDAGLFGVLQIPALQGRLPFGGGDSGVVVSESLARRFVGSALGGRIRQGDGSWHPIIGVTRDWLLDAKSARPLPTAFWPVSPNLSRLQIIVRTDAGASIIPLLRNAVEKWHPTEETDRIATVAQLLSQQMAEPELTIRLIGVFAIFALILSSIGVYGVMNYSTTRRIREMGIRLALGASPRQVFALILRESFLLIGVGTCVGWLMGIGVSRILSHELPVRPADPLTSIACSFAILLTGLLASYMPARRAARTEPMMALRAD